MTYRIVAVRREEDLRQLEDEWTALLLRASNSTVFSSFQWNMPWWRFFGPGNRLHVLAVRTEMKKGGGDLVAIAPFMVSRLGPVRKLEFLGTGLADYGDLLVHPEFTRHATAAVLAYLRARHRSWDIADLSEVPAFSSLLSYPRGAWPSGLRVSLVPQTLCPVIDLPGSWEAYVSGLARKRRYYVASFPRKFIREQSGRLEIIDGGSRLEAAVARFHDLHMGRWEGRQEELSQEHVQPTFEPFLREMCGRCAEMGWVRVAGLWAGERQVASSLNFLLHDRWSGYMKGFDTHWSKARPGTVLDALRINRAIEEGARRFDFGRGDEAYKSGYGVRIEQNTRVIIANPSPRSVAAYTLLMMRIRYKAGKQPAGANADKEDTQEDELQGH